jgi:hypothetical protein
VFLLDVWQQALFAQHCGLHAFSLATLDRMHERAKAGIAVTESVIPSKNAIAVLFSIALTY